MTKFIGNRGVGKSYWATWFASVNDAVVICKHPDFVKEKAKELGCEIPVAISFNEYFRGALKGSNKKIVIDELSLMLDSLGGEVIGFTDTEGDYYENN